MPFTLELPQLSTIINTPFTALPGSVPVFELAERRRHSLGYYTPRGSISWPSRPEFGGTKFANINDQYVKTCVFALWTPLRDGHSRRSTSDDLVCLSYINFPFVSPSLDEISAV